MSLSTSSRPRGVTASGPSATPTLYAMAAGIALAVALGLAAAATVQTPAPVTTAPALLGGIAAAAAIVAVVVFVARLVSGRAHRRHRNAEMLTWIEELQPASASTVASSVPSRVAADRVAANRVAVSHEEYAREAPETRALRLHIRALEIVLEERTGRLSHLEQNVHARDGQDLQRVLVTVGALRDRVHGDHGAQQVLDRVEAAISRLAVSPNSGRPSLPPHRTSSPQFSSPAPTAADPLRPPDSAPYSAQTATMTSAPVEAPTTGSDDPVDSAAAPTPPTRDDEVVLPVPAPTPTRTTRTRRRFRRRSAA